MSTGQTVINVTVARTIPGTPERVIPAVPDQVEEEVWTGTVAEAASALGLSIENVANMVRDNVGVAEPTVSDEVNAAIARALLVPSARVARVSIAAE